MNFLNQTGTPMSSPTILDTTLRDGSYAIDFQISKQETFRIAKKLDSLGFQLIEIGHGTGLGSSEKNLGIAAASDEEYMIAGSNAVVKGKWGMFCMPRIAESHHLKMASFYGMDFVRIGTEVLDVKAGQYLIETAKKYGMYVFCNLMKSYVVTPKIFAKQAAKCLDMGANAVYIVDSAGGMMPHEIQNYIDELRCVNPSVKIGFHGHNNLGMAVANSLYCAQQGFDFIDTSLQGLGRSAGNTPISQYLSVLSRCNFRVDFDLIDVMTASEELARSLAGNVGCKSTDVAFGLAQFHSAFFPYVQNVANTYGIDVKRLIVEVSKLNRQKVDQDVVAMAVSKLLKDNFMKHGFIDGEAS